MDPIYYLDNEPSFVPPKVKKYYGKYSNACVADAFMDLELDNKLTVNFLNVAYNTDFTTETLRL